MNSFFQSDSFLPMIHSIRAVVICAQSTNRFFKLAQYRKSVVLVLWADHFIIVLRNRLYKTESAVSNIAGSLYF